MIKNILIVTAKTNIDYSIFNSDSNYIVGVERGCLDLIEKGIKIDLAIADFDKVIPEELELIKTNAKSFEILEVDKDLLDGEIAILRALEIEHQKIIFVANPTKRFDKNISIFNLIFKYGIHFMNDETTMFRINKGLTTLDFNNYQNKTFISFYAYEKTNISIRNMKYNAENLVFSQYENTCISNAFIPYQNPEIETNKNIICIMTK
ncbi:thiamine diphosphokinase [[Acholeplasma] multilocale]|uniref:thiamine diphosphokinase n=1 Tax=[Acholeplasma] multilocale TaxID=264638 RepID=UPI00040D3132|nr:thiamine diphosphokinase [[Acholeplasma] multilocale]